jgi:hypothetical protein
MLLHCHIAGRKTPYRPRFLSRQDGAIRLCGFLPLRIGAIVELAERQTSSQEPARARVSGCECTGDGLFVIDLQLIGY